MSRQEREFSLFYSDAGGSIERFPERAAFQLNLVNRSLLENTVGRGVKASQAEEHPSKGLNDDRFWNYR